MNSDWDADYDTPVPDAKDLDFELLRDELDKQEAEVTKLRAELALATGGARYFHGLLTEAYALLVEQLAKQGLSSEELQKHPLLAEMRLFVKPGGEPS